ncbi:SusD/RagB family nutrient-binding outer membrane lipoprotein [Leyella stercorea]|uniref:SusD/RagB family nutrient-binding outer membrane lipoprotein n=1 Tax=Leyella stercorea TaxID=363265 RepID=UPI00242DE83E|nr:SusD/RagB family nutrient-binding outer membrane lipoprotein [Leyella stercorea]
MKNNKSAFFAVAVSTMLGMGAIEANAQQTRYKGTVTIHQKDGTKTSIDESGLWRIENGEDYVYAVTKQIQPQKYTDVDHVSFDWIAHEVGNISLNYKREISADELKQTVKDMRTQLKSALNAIYGLRGGDGSGYPVAHRYQFQNTLGPDCYVQYFCVPHYDFPYSNFTLRSTYALSQACTGPGEGFSTMKLNMAPVLNASKIDYMPEIKAIYLTLFNYSAIENVDLFGPLTYYDNKGNFEGSTFEYDRVKDIYYQVKADIDAAIECFKYYKDHRSDAYKKQIGATIGNYVMLRSSYDIDPSDLSVWIRFANSLKLRMAIHMSKVEPATAKQWAEEAVSDGVIDSPDNEIAVFPAFAGVDHPLVQITDWHDIAVGASFMNLLQNLDHPYMKYLFEKNSIYLAKSPSAVSGSTCPETTPINSVYVGMRNGVTPGEGQAPANNLYAGYSMLNKTYLAQVMPPLYLMKCSEVFFLMAEGALRGWNMGGTAQSFYERGIRTAYLEDRNYKENEYTKHVEQYLNVNAPKGIAYVDPQGLTPDMPSVTKIGVKWNESDSKETKLEKIITQKYIASFPYSYESWVDLRRTGYPKLFPILNTEHSDGTIKPGDQKVQTADNIMRRIPWVPDDSQTKEDINDTGIPALSEDTNNKPATDTQMQRLWWDVDAPNF